MKIKEIIKDEIITRAAAARDLRDSIKINDMSICGGCDGEGIQIYNGIEQIAAIMGEELHEDVIDDGKWIITTQWFYYGTDEDDNVKFYQRSYKNTKPQAIKPTVVKEFD